MKKGNKLTLKAVDFFCGGGGMSHGFCKAGVKVLGGIDIDQSCKDTYEANNNGAKFIEADITSLCEQELSKKLKIKRNDDQLIFIGCSPCQYWSLMQTSKTKSEKTKNLLGDFQRFVEYFNPGYVVIENVPGILNKNKKSVLPAFVDFLNSKNYKVSSQIVNINQYGIPQSRKRFVLLASRIKSVNLPKPNGDTMATVKDFIGQKNGFPKINAGHKDHTKFMHTSSALSTKNLQRIRLTPKDGGTRSAWKDTDLQIPAYKGKDKAFNDVYGRMFWDRPAPTITTKFFSISNGRFGHPVENRAISLREGATLQTFPKEYEFKANSIGTIGRIIGNAVPPKFSEIIAKSLL